MAIIDRKLKKKQKNLLLIKEKKLQAAMQFSQSLDTLSYMYSFLSTCTFTHTHTQMPGFGL